MECLGWGEFFLMHLVFDIFVHFRELASEVEVNVEVKISLIPFVGARSERSVQFFALLHGQVIVEVEHRLFPVSVGTFWTGGEPDAFVAVGKFDVEEANQCVDVVVPSHRELEGSGKGAVLHGNGGDVNFFDQTGVGDDLLRIHHVHQRLADSHLLHARHVESVHVFPPVDLLILVLAIRWHRRKAWRDPGR